jgi:hypothetical protein
MRVYHGSYTKIEKIDLSKCKPNKDFGKGFYVTKFRHHAENWASVIGEKNDAQGFITEFEYIDGDFVENICKIKRFESYNEEWLDFVVKNRDKRNKEAVHDYDIVEGPVANDKIQNTLRLYLKEKITKEKFLKMLSRHETTHQICFCTLNSLQCIEQIDSASTLDIIMISEPLLEKLMIDNNIDEEKAVDIFYTSQTFNLLSDVTTEYYKKPWQEIYKMLKMELKSK